MNSAVIWYGAYQLVQSFEIYLISENIARHEFDIHVIHNATL